jgi:three-Cys-motif partner protein
MNAKKKKCKMGRYHITLNEEMNPSCLKCSSSEMRKEHQEDYLCTTALSTLDQLPTRCVGEWAYDKIYRLVQYFGIFAKGMKDKWSELNYIEICSGPGRCILRELGEEIDGTSLAIIKHKSFGFINKALFIDYNDQVVEILSRRIKDLNKDNIASAIKVDFNDHISLRKHLDQLSGGLNLVFIDPTECNVPFSTVREIVAVLEKVDFIINVADGTDANRNLPNAILKQQFFKVRDKYIQFLGSDDFFQDPEARKLAEAADCKKLRELFLEYYQASLKSLGYEYLDLKVVRHYYHLLYATSHVRGLDYWEKANKYEPNGQGNLSF